MNRFSSTIASRPWWLQAPVLVFGLTFTGCASRSPRKQPGLGPLGYDTITEQSRHPQVVDPNQVTRSLTPQPFKPAMGPPGIDAIFAQTVEQLRQKPQFDLLSDPDIVIKPVTTRSGGLDPSPLSSASPEGRELMGWSENAGEFQDLSAFSDPSP